MVVTEFKNTVSTVRIHDEYCELSADRCISRLSQIISESYKRRQLLSGMGDATTDIIAASATTNVQKI